MLWLGRLIKKDSGKLSERLIITENERESRRMQHFSHHLIKNHGALHSEVPAAEVCHLQKCGSIQELDTYQIKITKTAHL